MLHNAIEACYKKKQRHADISSFFQAILLAHVQKVELQKVELQKVEWQKVELQKVEQSKGRTIKR